MQQTLCYRGHIYQIISAICPPFVVTHVTVFVVDISNSHLIYVSSLQTTFQSTKLAFTQTQMIILRVFVTVPILAIGAVYAVLTRYRLYPVHMHPNLFYCTVSDAGAHVAVSSALLLILGGALFTTQAYLLYVFLTKLRKVKQVI